MRRVDIRSGESNRTAKPSEGKEQMIDTSQNSAFSSQLPGLQLAIDSTSLGEFKICPRRYQYSIVEGWQTRATSVHLEFGIWYHEAIEYYDRSRFAGAGHKEALRAAVRKTLEATWNAKLGRPWVSSMPTPEKNRLTLLRSIVWYLDQFGAKDPMKTVELANGKPAVELSFQFEFSSSEVTNEPVTLCGHLDRLATLNDRPYVVDKKTTKHLLNEQYFAQFTPDNQMSMYASASKVVFDLPVEGVIVDGAQVLVSGTRFGRFLVPRTSSQLDEWLADTLWWTNQMGEAAERGLWPQNDKSCHHYGGCQFRPVCSRPPGAREQWLKLEFVKRTWDPLVAR